MERRKGEKIKKFKVIHYYKLPDTTLTESVSGNIHRFIATIYGIRGWKIYEGEECKESLIIDKINDIRDRISNNDRSIYYDKNEFLRDEGE